jgi:effector-binding domain-containing protein
MKRVVYMIVVFFVFISLPLFSEQDEAWEKEQPVLKEVEVFWFAYMDFKGPYSLIIEKARVFFQEFKKQGLKAQGDFLVAYYNSPRENKPEDLEWGTAVPIHKDADVKPPLKKGGFKKILCVTILHTGPEEKIQVSNDKVKKYIDDNGYKMVWPAYEIFHRKPPGIEIIHPVVKK